MRGIADPGACSGLTGQTEMFPRTERAKPNRAYRRNSASPAAIIATTMVSGPNPANP
jgi:hypothetical protein